MVVHDSFYMGVEKLLRRAFSNLNMVHANSSDLDIRVATSEADLLIFQRAERFILSAALEPTGVGWNGALGDWLLSQSGYQTRRCDWMNATDFLEAGASLHLGDVHRADRNKFAAISAHPQIYLRLAPRPSGQRLCLRAQVKGSGTAQLFLQHESFEFPGAGPRFTEGRSVTWRLGASAPTTISLVLPAGTYDVLRIDPVDGEGEFEIQELKVASRD